MDRVEDEGHIEQTLVAGHILRPEMQGMAALL